MDRPSRKLTGSSTSKPSSSVRPKPAPGGAGSGGRSKEGSGIRRAPEPAPQVKAVETKRRAPAPPPEPPPPPPRSNPPSAKMMRTSGGNAANANPVPAAGKGRRGAGRPGKAGGTNPMLYVGIGGGVLLVILVAVMMGGSHASAKKKAPPSKLQPGVHLQVTESQWKAVGEGKWMVHGTIQNHGDQAAEKVIVAYYPCGPESRIKDRTGAMVAVVCAAKLSKVGPGESVDFTTAVNPPAIQEGTMSAFPEKRSEAFYTFQGGPALPGPIQEAIFDPLDRADWGGKETEWAQERQKGRHSKAE